MRAAGVDPGLRHAANSAAVFRSERARLDVVRPGIALFGVTSLTQKSWLLLVGLVFAGGGTLLGLAGFYASNLLGLFHKARLLVGQVASGEVEPFLATTILSPDSSPAPEAWLVLAMTSMLALVGSFMVSYTRARAEGLGLECKVGFFERPERIVLLIIAGLAQTFVVMSVALVVLTVLSFWTAAQRMVHVHRVTRATSLEPENTEA